MIVIKNISDATIGYSVPVTHQKEMQLRALIEKYLMVKHSIICEVEVKDE
jgi:hypothetical protein